ncbi:hypothetical protein D8Y20_02780 [Mariprofundus sp. EBB-1]|uniref:adenylate/guanylate cyclase domain-containing protein n=1 Tax=Mariprofundus sp. EBB-1 TaxID=2650971 RepID=UPI000EF20E3F|nr:adenylate/guanylate cyclase domain-containing protein [Mariprofundus sp. EBB-1]RLL54722.1 hypothetical protein D8Y20_02780 [Mariprofundus sp. EBB-1]
MTEIEIKDAEDANMFVLPRFLTLPLLMLLPPIYYIGEILKYLLMLFGLALLAFYAITFIPADNETVQFFLKLESGFRDFYLPFLSQLHVLTVNGVTIPQIVIIIGVFVVRYILNLITETISDHIKYLKLRRVFQKLEAAKSGDGDSMDTKGLVKLESNLKGLVKNNKMGRQEMLDLYGQVHRSLEEMKRELTFLSIDVVDSTGMKKGEKAIDAELDFQHYNQLVEAAFKHHGYLKAAWTPDGVMCCFPSADGAVGAAKQILADLEPFNHKERTIQQPFHIRCGINSGKVAYDENMPLETLCDHVLDIAGHFQKYGTPDYICISKHAYNLLSEPEAFAYAEKEVDDVAMYINK